FGSLAFLEVRRPMARIFFEPLAFLGPLAWALLLEARRPMDRAFFGPPAFLVPLASAWFLIRRTGLVEFAFLGPTRLLPPARLPGKATSASLETRSAPRTSQAVLC